MATLPKRKLPRSTCCNPGPSVLTKGVRHRHASVERIKLDREHGDGTWFSSSLPGGERASLKPSFEVILRAARCNKALRGFDCE